MKKISFILILIAVILIFRKLFLAGPVVFGDAPFFYKEGLAELVANPTAWIARGNTLGGVNLFLWIYPLMLLYGALGSILHLSNDLILRILFYFSSLIFGFTGVYFFTKYLKFSRIVQFFSVLIYLVNTYYLLLVDGGQVGVVLAYGLFPLVLLFLLKAIDKISLRNFLIALVSGLVLTIVDFRIAIISFLAAFLWRISKFKKLWVLFLIGFCLLGLSSYWVLPILRLASGGVATQVSGLGVMSILNSLFLSAPNWPTNEFGKVVAPYFYFSIIPILVFLPFFLVKSRKITFLTILFLIFTFLAKGTSAPFGSLYTFFVNTGVGSVFRDSTKFFIPLVLIAGILIGKAVEFVKNRIFTIFVFLYILFLVNPAVLGKLNGVLGKNINLSDYQKVYQEISKQEGFLRSAWFVEKSPFAYHTEEKQALDAKGLVDFRLFASFNAGTGDRFNFMNNSQYLDFFEMLGIKYLIFNGNPRVQTLSKSDKEDWDRLMKIVSNDKRLIKLDIGTSFPVFETPNIHPNKFFVDKTFLVIGGDDVYEKFFNLDKDFSVGNQGFLFFEDGKSDPSNLEGIASTSGVLVFNAKSREDLKMGFLQKDFISPTSASFSQWAIRSPSQYLAWKYELLIHGVDTHEFDYNQGIAFSSEKGEKLGFDIRVPEDGSYYLEIRSMAGDASSDLGVSFAGETNMIKRRLPSHFEWFEKAIDLKAGKYSLEIRNPGGFQVVNVVALIPASEMGRANQSLKNFLGHFQSYSLEDDKDRVRLIQVLRSNYWENFDGEVKKQGWIIYTDSFNENWKLRRGVKENPSFPMFSAVNGFYVDPSWGDVKIIFKGDEYIRWGIYFSSISLLLIVIVTLWILSK